MILEKISIITQMFKYNLKIIFANKFIYFLLGATIFFLIFTVVDLFDTESFYTESSVYYLLLFPGLLIIFYPSTFGIQNDVDTRMIEVLFGIPNYRYKVWLSRLAIIFFVVYGFLIGLSLLSSISLIPVPAFEMALQLMFPIFFLGALGFLFSTITRSGAGTAAVMVLICLFFWISSGILSTNEWNIFLNPYDFPDNLSPVVWSEMLFYNRLYLLIGSSLAILAALYRLQKREKFI